MLIFNHNGLYKNSGGRPHSPTQKITKSSMAIHKVRSSSVTAQSFPLPETLTSSPLTAPAASRTGSVVLAVLILVMLGVGLVGSYMKLTLNDVSMTRRSLDHEKALIAAEAGLDYGIVNLKNVILNYRLSPSITTNDLQTMLNSISPPPDLGDFRYITPNGQPAFRIRVLSDVISGTINEGTTCRGSEGYYQFFDVTCGAIGPQGEGAVLKQRVQAVGLQLIRFGVFYEPDLEILPGATMQFFGPVHVNENLYLGGPLQFLDRVTSRGDIYHRRKDSAARPGNVRVRDTLGNLTSMIQGGEYIDSDHDDWMGRAIELWGGNLLSGSHGVARLSPPINPLDENHDIIERALPTNHPNYSVETEREKFYNKASVRIHVDSNGVLTATDWFTNDVSHVFSNVTLQVSGINGTSGDPEYAKNADGDYLLATNGIIDITQTNLFDAREGTYVAPVDIYLDQLQAGFPDLFDGTYGNDQGRGILYVTRDPPVSGNLRPAVRLRNGREIVPANGLTIASDLPVYVEGNYNVTNNVKPSMVAADAITLLSSEWQDARSTLGGGANERRAEDTEYNTVLMLGNQETSWGDYNGGLENVLRFLERWSGQTALYRGSIICLWSSEEATGRWYYGNGPNNNNSGRRRFDNSRVRFRYTAPKRNWGYDDIYRVQAPPGMTSVFGMEELIWERTTWANEGW